MGPALPSLLRAVLAMSAQLPDGLLAQQQYAFVAASAAAQQNFAALLPPSWKQLIPQWLAEDIPSFDYGGFVVGDKLDTATLWCKSPGVLAGCPFVNEIFAHLNCTVEWHTREGEYVDTRLAKGGKVAVATVRGTARNLLMGERTALNLMARCAGIATRARKVAELQRAHGYQGAIAGTRKTTPGFRIVEKYALLVGGVDPHRMDLSSMTMLKDNHVWSTGSITNAVHAARRVGGFSLKIEVECRTLDEADEAARAGADIVMLDNYGPQQIKAEAMELKQKWPKLLVEASGGITEDNVADYFSPHIDVLSMGSLTQGVPHVDYSLKIVRPGFA